MSYISQHVSRLHFQALFLSVCILLIKKKALKAFYHYHTYKFTALNTIIQLPVELLSRALSKELTLERT